jgi:hypothetical protein
MAPRSSSAATCLCLALAAATLALAHVRTVLGSIGHSLNISGSDDDDPSCRTSSPACSSSDACHCHCRCRIQGAQGGGPSASAADLDKVTAETFLDIEIDGKPAGSYACVRRAVHAWIYIRRRTQPSACMHVRCCRPLLITTQFHMYTHLRRPDRAGTVWGHRS